MTAFMISVVRVGELANWALVLLLAAGSSSARRLSTTGKQIKHAEVADVAKTFELILMRRPVRGLREVVDPFLQVPPDHLLLAVFRSRGTWHVVPPA